MSLYRQYRPQTFDDVVGQEPIITTLRQAADAGKLAHAYLLAGTRGTGKTSTARILAKTLLVNGIPDTIIKGQIEKAVEEGTLVDLVEIDAASNTGVDNIRDLIEKIQFTPVVASAKVYIIDEVHMLSKGAFNALLKTLEEPPPYAYFILATTELHKIPATIQSRCQRFLFRRINEQDIAGRLRHIATEEKIEAEDAALLAIAHHAEGGLRDAISLLDQLRSLPAVTLQDVKERIGETGHDAVDAMLSAIETGDRTLVMQTVRGLEETGTPLETFVRLMLETVRTRLHQQIKDNQSTASLEPLLTALLQTVRDLRASPLPALTLESSLLSLLPKKTSHENVRHEAQETILETRLPARSPEAKEGDSKLETAPVPTVASTPATEPIASSIPGSIDLPTLKSKWSEILESVEPASARMSLKNGRLHTLTGSELVLAFSSSFHRDKASTPEALHSLEDSITKAMGANLTVRCLLESELHGAPVHQEEIDLAAAVTDVF
jgi:DNA polymerase III subunit gamma/tau